MCTAVSCSLSGNYFGRNLDVECSYGETVVITPREFVFKFRKEGEIKKHYAIIGIAKISDGYPLYFDGVNEKGLGMAALNFPENAVYNPPCEKRDNITSFEIIPWVLSRCSTVDEAEQLLAKINITNESFSDVLGSTPLHWIISDKLRSVTIESVKSGVKVYPNPVGVLTNNPPFDIQLFNLNNYMKMSAQSPTNTFSDKINLKSYSRGMGAMGLPGDLSSMSRFVRAVFTKYNMLPGKNEEESVNRFFRILWSVYQQKGCVKLDNGNYEYTSYSTCANIDTGQFYYTTYQNSRINCVSLFSENLDGCSIISYPMLKNTDFYMQNGEK